jgi:thiamine pyridinylase
MPLLRLICALIFVAGAICAPFRAFAEYQQPITLRVLLYPFVPDQYAIFTFLAREFQRRPENKGITLELVEIPPDKDYYADGLITSEADIYETDSILLTDMIKTGKIAPLSLSLSPFAKEAAEAVTRDGKVYAAPHWLCGNFLFHRRGDAAIADAATWADVLKEMNGADKGLFIDFFGHLTLGELYLTLLSNRLGVSGAQTAVMQSAEPDAQALGDMRSILAGCPAGFCRSKALHNKAGFYARAFMRGEARAYVGYSESLHYGVQEVIDGCHPGSGCLDPGEVAVRRLPPLSAVGSNEGIGWVDGLAVAANLNPEKRAAAIAFIEYATSEEAYKLVLTPAWMEAPRYLLPARVGMDWKSFPPLYPDLISAHAGRRTGTVEGLNAKLRSLSDQITCKLPIDRTDTKTAGSCPVH